MVLINGGATPGVIKPHTVGKYYYSEHLIHEMEDCIGLINLKRFSRFLRTMVYQHVRQHHLHVNTPEFLSFLTDIELFFQFLDRAEDEHAAKVAAGNKR